MNREYRVVANTGENHSKKVERKITASGPHSAATAFAAEFNETIFPGREERPTEHGAVWSYGWTGHGQRIWVYEG